MIVNQFNTYEGLYEFQMDALETTPHSHPAVEVLLAERGSFQLNTDQAKHRHLYFAVVPANVTHQVVAEESILRVLMLERREKAVQQFLNELDIAEVQGLCVIEKDGFTSLDCHSLFDEIYLLHKDSHYDERVKLILDYLNAHEMPYEGMLDALCEMVNLSKSRVSHLFKLDVGVSLKKYLLWCRLRNTIASHLDQEEDLFTSLVKSGFYDQPHFSRAFKNMLGIKPTMAYNSRTVQG